jgi:hypothetical protein
MFRYLRVTLLGAAGARGICKVANADQHYVLVATVDTRRDADRYLHDISIVPQLDDLIGLLIKLFDDVERLPMPKPIFIDMAFALEPAERDHINRILDARATLNLSQAAVHGSA